MFREDGLLSAALGLDWFEGAIAKPDLVLADFYTAFHPTGPVRTEALFTQPCIQGCASCSAIEALQRFSRWNLD